MWTQLGLWAGAVPLSPCALAAESIARTQTALTAEVVARRELVTAALQWLDATLARDFAAQSAFYPETMDAFYQWRDVPKGAVMAEKRRVFEQARTIDIRIDPPQLLIDSGARSGRMYFRKSYVIKGKLNRTGEVLQELRWVKQADGWKIISERDLRVIRQVRRQP
jgi:ketosteroid isomerase-like protein